MPWPISINRRRHEHAARHLPFVREFSMIRMTFMGCIALLLAACSNPVAQPAGTPVMPLEIEGVIIQNLLAYPVTDVQILSLASGNFVSCGNIMQRSRCATTFPIRNYQRNPVQISWKERGTEYSMPPFVIDIPEGFSLDKAATIEVSIVGPGQAGAELVQPE